MIPSRLVLVALALVPALSAGAPPGRARIELTADPAQVELGSGATVTLHIASADAPVLTASVGEVRLPKAVGKGQFDAVYVPPSETFPQVAIIVARTARASGWLALPLAGSGEVSVDPDASGSATVTVGARRFGPQRPGPDGKAAVRIVVPPGTRYAVSGGKRLKLGAPEVPHLFLAVDGEEVASNVSGALAVRVFAVTPDGKPRRGAPLRLGASPGTVSAPREVEPGVYDATWSLPAAPGAATVEARLEDERAVQRVSVQRGDPEPQRLEIEVERSSVAAGEGTLDFTLVVEDGTGKPVEGVSPRATISTGTFLGWTRGPPGRWIGHVSVPEHLDSASLIIVATAGELMARREVALVAGPPAEVALQGEVPGGKGPGTVTVSTLDRYGNATDETPPEAKASLGTVGPAARQAPGVYRFAYRPPVVVTAPQDVIRVTAGRAERVLEVALARREVLGPRLELGPKGGVVTRSSVFGPALGADVAAFLPGGDGQLGLVLDGGWFQLSREKTVSSGSGSLALQSTATYLAFTLAPTWRRTLGERAVLWASLGGGAVRAQSSSRLGTQPTIEESAWVPAGTAALSLGARVWGGFPYLELRVTYVGDPKLAGLSGSFVPIFLQVGYRFDTL